MNYLRTAIIFHLIICLQLMTLAQTAGKHMLVKPLQDKVFIKEQGQFSKNAGETKTPFPEPILYGVENAEFNAYFTAHGIIFQFPESRNIEEKDREKVGREPEERSIETIWHTANMRWVNTDSSAEITAENKTANYYNYGGFNSSEDDKTFYSFVPAYKKIKYINLYPGVDVEFELPEEGGIKYRFFIKPNAVIPKISFQWDGLEKLTADEKGDLHLKSKFSPISLNSEWQLLDHAPNAFTASSHKDIPVKYNVVGSLVEFQFSSDLISSPEGIIIDPWLTNTADPDLNRAFDIQKDSIGNVFIHGNHTNYHIEKYNSAGVLQWSYVTYSVFLGDIAVDNPGNVYIIGGYCTGKRQKLDSTGVQIWSLGGLCEEWRLAMNYSKTVLAVCGYFVNPGGNNLARLDMATGAVSDQIAYNEETRSISTDCNGDMFSLHLPTNTLRKTNADFTPGGSVPSGLNLIYAGTGYALNPVYSPSVFQGFNGTLIIGQYVYIYDGITLRRFNKTTLTHVNTVTVPNGVNYQCSGLAADACGNVYAGSTTGIVKFDSALTYISAITTPGAVYDIILGSNNNLLACGEGFLGSFSITCTPPPPLTVISTSTNVNCIGGTATAVVYGGIAPYNYIWEPSGQTVATATNLTEGTYTYTVTDPFCHSYHDTISVHKTPLLASGSSLINNPTCFGFADGSASVSFSGGTLPYTYSWNSNPIQTNDTASGLAAGSYTVTIIDADNCVKTASINLTEPAVLSAAASASVVRCFAGSDGGASVVPNGGTLPYTYSWNSSPPQTTVAAINLPAGSYTCTVTDSNSCVKTASASVTQPAVIFIDAINADTICAGQTVLLSAVAHDGNPGGYTYTWSSPAFTGQNNSVSPAVTSTYTVIAADFKSCLSAPQTAEVKVNPLPTAGISGSAAVCRNANSPNITFTGAVGTAPYTFIYKINGGADQTAITNSGNSVNIAAPTGTPGTYTYSLVSVKDASSTACFQTQTGSTVITIYPSPAAKFGSSKECNGSATQFTDSSTTSTGTISAWHWSFGDTSPVNNTQNPSHLYVSAGNYNVNLIVNNNFGCADTITKPVQVYYNPVAGFKFSNVCFGDSMHFSDTSTVHSSTSVGSYLWSFGDNGPTGSLQNPNHYYFAAGTYTVTLVTTTIDGCSNASIIPVKTFDAPASGFSFSNTCLFNSAEFTNNTTSPIMGSTANWLWDFGDGSAVNTTVWSPSHLYTIPGNYQITLITHSSNLGCPDTMKHNLTVYPMPNANFIFSNVCLNEAINFTDLSAVSSGSTTGWSWNFGDLTPLSTVQSPGHTYADPGTYTVTLIVTTDNGCKDTIAKNDVVHPLPSAHFSAANVCDGSIVQFNDLSNITATDTIQSWAWHFGDGSPVVNNKNTSHLYASNGSYTVQLLIVSNFGCLDSISKMIVINPNPVISFTADDTIGCEPICVNFQNLSSIATGFNAGRLWIFGDNSPSVNSMNPFHCYNNDSVYSPNYFNVTLTVTSDSGCVSSLSKNNYITVYPNPNTSFTVEPQTAVITDPVISITDLSVGANFWNWNFGDNDTSSAVNPLPHTYADTGMYIITLITSTQYNCLDTMNQTIVIDPDFLFYIPSAFTPNDDGINDNFYGKGIFIIKYEMTIFDRWGNLIFFSDDINKTWDGKANHGTETAEGDVYIYSFKVTDIKKRKHNYKGTVTLVR